MGGRAPSPRWNENIFYKKDILMIEKYKTFDNRSLDYVLVSLSYDRTHTTIITGRELDHKSSTTSKAITNEAMREAFVVGAPSVVVSSSVAVEVEEVEVSNGVVVVLMVVVVIVVLVVVAVVAVVVL